MTKKRHTRTAGQGWFHAVLVFLRKLRDAFRGKEPAGAKPRKAAPFCATCGERTRPWDPDDEQRHAHDQQGAPPA